MATCCTADCDGWFGRDSYDEKRVEAIGSDWVVVRDDRGDALAATGLRPEVLIPFLDKEATT